MGTGRTHTSQACWSIKPCSQAIGLPPSKSSCMHVSVRLMKGSTAEHSTSPESPRTLNTRESWHRLRQLPQVKGLDFPGFATSSVSPASLGSYLCPPRVLHFQDRVQGLGFRVWGSEIRKIDPWHNLGAYIKRFQEFPKIGWPRHLPVNSVEVPDIGDLIAGPFLESVMDMLRPKPWTLNPKRIQNSSFLGLFCPDGTLT